MAIIILQLHIIVNKCTVTILQYAIIIIIPLL